MQKSSLVHELAAFKLLPRDIVTIVHHFGNPQVAIGKLCWTKSLEIPGGCDWAFVCNNIIVTRKTYPTNTCLIFVDYIQCGVFELSTAGLGSPAFIRNIRIIEGTRDLQIFISIIQPKCHQRARHSVIAVVNQYGIIQRTIEFFEFEEFDAGHEIIVSFSNILQVRNRRSNRPPPCLIEIRNHDGIFTRSWQSHLFGRVIQTDKYGYIFLIGDERGSHDTIHKYDQLGNLLLSMNIGSRGLSAFVICESPIRDIFFVSNKFRVEQYSGGTGSQPSRTTLIDNHDFYIIGGATLPNGNLLFISADVPASESGKTCLLINCYQ